MFRILEAGKRRFSVDVLGEGDIEEILEIERDSFPVPWTREMFIREKKIPFSRFYTLRERETNTLSAYCGFWLIRDEMHITNVAVHRSCRRLGVGSVFLAFALEEGRSMGACSVFLEMRVSNHEALGLYRKLGFRTIGRRPCYYANGEDAAVLKKEF